MAMQFNPSTAFLRGMDLGSPTTSQSGINNLMNMQQQTIQDIIGTVGNIGKTSRTNTVNDLIARGGLEGLNEAQTQARIQQEAGGTLTPEGQQTVERLLQTTGKEDQRKFATQERLGGQNFISGENVIKAEALQKSQEQKNALDKLINDQNLSQKERDSLRDFKASMYGHEVTRGGQKQLIQGADGMQYFADKPTGRLTKLVEGTLPANVGDGYGTKGGGATKLTGDVKKLWDVSELGAKDAIDQFYKSNKFNVKRFIEKGEDGIRREKLQPQWYGKPIHTSEMTNFIETGYLPARFKGVVPQKLGAKFIE